MKTEILIHYYDENNTLINGGVISMENFLYEPRDILIIKGIYFNVKKVRDEINIENKLVRKIYLERA